MTYPKLPWKTALLVAAVCAAGAAAQAQLTITQNSNAPTENIYRHSPTPDGGASVTAYWRATRPQEGSTLNRSIGQGFSTAGAEGKLSLSTLTFQVGSLSNLPEGLSVSISIFEGAGPNQSPSNSNVELLSKQVGNLPEALVVGDYITFALETPVILTADRFYSVVFAFEELTNPGSAVSSIGFSTIGAFRNTDENLGANVRRWLGDDGVWAASLENGFVMYVGATPVVPESSTYALIGGTVATLAVLCLRHRRRCR